MRDVMKAGQAIMGLLIAIGVIHIATSITMYALARKAENTYTVDRP